LLFTLAKHHASTVPIGSKHFAFSNLHFSSIILPTLGRTTAQNQRNAPTGQRQTPPLGCPFEAFHRIAIHDFRFCRRHILASEKRRGLAEEWMAEECFAGVSL